MPTTTESTVEPIDCSPDLLIYLQQAFRAFGHPRGLSVRLHHCRGNPVEFYRWNSERQPDEALRWIRQMRGCRGPIVAAEVSALGPDGREWGISLPQDGIPGDLPVKGVDVDETF